MNKFFEKLRSVVLVTILFASTLLLHAEEFSGEAFKRLFENPPNDYRLMQYQLNEQTLEKFPKYGIGGYMAFFYRELYQLGANGPSKITPVLEAAEKQGKAVWLADDFGYPSGMAGGMVVEQNPDFEVRGLLQMTRDGVGRMPITLQIPEDTERIEAAVIYPLKNGSPVFEEGKVLPVTDERVLNTTGIQGPWQLCVFVVKVRDRDTQARTTQEQFQHSGGYPDLKNRAAVKLFIDLMHAGLIEAAGGQLPDNVQGFYTNEPNLMMLYWVDADLQRNYAVVPWDAGLATRFKSMHGYDLIPYLGALYGGDAREARRVRMHFQMTVAAALTENFVEQIREWCAERGLLTSGHLLLNQYLSMHVACYGDLMKFASEFDVPSFDVGIPTPERMASFPYEQARFFSSIATWKDRDEVICLLDPIITGGGLERLSPPIGELKNSANMAFSNGANLLTSYLPLDPINTPDSEGRTRKATGYSPEEFSSFNEYVGRIAMLLRGAHRETSVAVLYPIRMAQADFKPSNLVWPKMTSLYAGRQYAWDVVLRSLQDADLDYEIIHPEALENATIRNGQLEIGRGSYGYLVMPNVEILSKAAMEKILDLKRVGGAVFWVGSKPAMAEYASNDEAVRRGCEAVEVIEARDLPRWIETSYSPDFDLSVEPGTDVLSVVRFHRNGKKLYFIVNRTGEPVEVKLRGASRRVATIYDPLDGRVEKITLPAGFHLESYGSLLVLIE